jgi:hypothetical protein
MTAIRSPCDKGRRDDLAAWRRYSHPMHKGVEDYARYSPTARCGHAETGLPFKKRYFAGQWEAACKAANLVDLHFHDIRGTTVTMPAEAGCTLPEIVSITGHTWRRAQDILDKYLARTSKLADSAIAKFENVMETESANRLAN